MSLDDKLREILEDGALGSYMTDENGDFVGINWKQSPQSIFDPYITKIKQAFAESMPTWAEVIEQSQGVRMTGAEWYARFITELGQPTVVTIESTFEIYYKQAVIAAASRVANLENQNTKTKQGTPDDTK